MKWLRITLVLLGVIIVVGALVLGGRNYAARRAWQAMRPGLPEAVGASAPGLDARLAACSHRLQTWPPDRVALAEFSRLCHANGLLEPAMTGYQALTILEPDEARWPHLRASILAGYGRLDEALPLLRRTTVLAPDHLAGWLRLGEALFKANATGEAEAAFHEALRRAPGNPYALLGLARCDLQLERWTAARSHLQQAVAADPTFADAQSLLASVFERLGNPEAARLARSRMANDGRYTEAPDAWTDELTAWCHHPYTLLVAAATITTKGTPRQALPLLERALLLAPDDPRVHRQMAKTLSTLGDLAGGRAELEKTVALNPTDESLQLDLVALLRGAKDSAALERAVAAGLAACPASAGLHYEAGLLAAAAGQWDAAERHFAFSWQNRPDRPAAARELAKIFFRTNRNEAGVGVLEKILTQEPGNTAVHLQLVQHGIETGDQRTAAWLRQAVDSGAPELPLAELQQAFQRQFGAEVR
jgi:tetratricopeptide (TPR) repeat protein